MSTTDNNLFELGGINLPPLSIIKDGEISVDKLKLHIQSILNNQFMTPAKREIDLYSNRLNFACPYCGDSAKNQYAKRGNVFLKNMSFKCFNCGEYSSVYEFLKHFQTNCDIDDTELFMYRTYYNKSIRRVNNDIDIFNNKLINKWGIDREQFKNNLGLIEIEHTPGEIYLKKRYQRINDSYLYDAKSNNLYILNITPELKIIGYQLRILKTKKYFTYKLSTIYKELKRELSDEDKLEIDQIDKISSVFNILNLDYNQPITIFEGPFDSFLFPNSIAIAGAHMHSPIEAENLRFWFDNDETGKQNAIKELKKGHHIFLWKKYLKKVNMAPDIKDLNDIVIQSKINNIELLPFEEYFSNKKIDMIFL